MAGYGMDRCPSCGAAVLDGTKFCACCGANLATQIKPPESSFPGERTGKRRIGLVATLLFLMISAAAYGYFLARQVPSSRSSTTTVNSTGYQFVPADPTISNGPAGRANITYPSNYRVLANYSLNLINHDRHLFGQPTVGLSSVASGQQHANSMLYFGYFSHWDTQGYKPYMRFTLLGGKGSVEENISYMGQSCPPGYSCPWEFTSQDSVESAIAQAENAMVYNDSYCCGNEHRATILSASNDKVSIGVAWNSTDFFLVQDFVDTHASFSLLSYNTTSREVTLAGSMHNITSTEMAIAVFYDQTPVALAPAVLDPLFHGSEGYPSVEPACNSFNKIIGGYTFSNDGCTNYGGSYGVGYYLGVVVYRPSCPKGYTCTYSTATSDNAIQSYATVWQVSGDSFEVKFNLGPFTSYFGRGVYTIYFYPNYAMNETVTSYSIFTGPA